MRPTDEELGKKAQELLTEILLICDGHNASSIMTALQIAMIHIIDGVNEGNRTKAIIDLTAICDYMIDNYEAIALCDLEELGLDSETYRQH